MLSFQHCTYGCLWVYKYIEREGSNYVSYIFNQSDFGNELLNVILEKPPPKISPRTNMFISHVYVANETLPIQKNIMRSYPG